MAFAAVSSEEGLSSDLALRSLKSLRVISAEEEAMDSDLIEPELDLLDVLSDSENEDLNLASVLQKQQQKLEMVLNGMDHSAKPIPIPSHKRRPVVKYEGRHFIFQDLEFLT